MNDRSVLRGHGTVKVLGPDGSEKQRVEFTNLVTQVGDQCYGENGAGIASPPDTPTGMKLGTDSTAAAKTGAGAALGTYLSGSHASFDAGFPTSALSSSARRITYECTWAAGTATSSSIREVVIVNESPITDASSGASDTIARAVFGSNIDKGAGDSLVITWQNDLEGS